MFSLFCPLPCLRGVFEFAPSVSNVLIILSTSMSSWNNKNITNARGKLEHSTKTWKWTNNENITNSRDKLEHSTKTWKWTNNENICLRGVLEFAPSVSNVLIILSTSMSSWSVRVCP
jgi:hypothetical protein